MNIILACEIFPPDIGGPATYAIQLADALVNSGHSVRVVTYGEIKRDYPYFVMYVSRRIPFFIRQLIYFIRLWMISRKTELIYAQGPSVGPAAIFVKWLRRVRVVVKYVGDQSWQQVRMRGKTVGFEEYMKTYGCVWYGWKIGLIQWWQKFSLKNTDRVIVPSEYLNHVVVDYLDVKPEKVSVVPNGVEVKPGEKADAIEQSSNGHLGLSHREHHSPRQRPQDGDARLTLREGGRTEDCFGKSRNDIVFIGRLENWKGLDTLIEAFRLFTNEYTATVVGDGSARQSLELRVRSYKLQDRIRFIGRISRGELEHYLQSALCLYEGSEYEGMPHVVLESWSFGVPVVVSDFPANTELVRDGETGLVFKLGDARDLAQKVQSLSSDFQLWERLSRAGFEEHKKYSAESIMKKTIECLSSVRSPSNSS